MKTSFSVLPTSSEKLYKQVAQYLQNLIQEGTLQPGDRLPSVRKLNQQLSVSISTILEAYRLLEDLGLISVKPQSGYYVKSPSLAIPEQPLLTHPPNTVSTIDTSIAFQVRSAINDPNVIQLGAAIGSPELFPLATLNRLMGQVSRQQAELVHSYGMPVGCESLRHEVAKRLIDAGCAINPQQIVITNGTTEALFLALKAVTKPGDTIAIESPCYYVLLETLASLHLQVLELPTCPREGISLESLETALKRHQIAACLLVANFSNPLGTCMSDRSKQNLIELLNKYDIPLIEDDVYGELTFEGMRPKAVKAFDTEERVLYCSSISKTLSPGLRIGWIIPGRYYKQVTQLKIILNQGTAIAPQLTVASFLSNGGYDHHLRQLRKAYQNQIRLITQAVCAYFPPQIRLTQPQGGQVLWLELPKEFDTMILYQEALRYGISIAPGKIFSASNSYNNGFRLNCGIPWSEKLAIAIQTLGALSQKQLASKILADIKPLIFH